MVLKLQGFVLAASLGFTPAHSLAQGEDEATDIKGEEAQDSEEPAPQDPADDGHASEEAKLEAEQPTEEQKPAEESQASEDTQTKEDEAATPPPESVQTDPTQIDDKKPATDVPESQEVDGVRRAPGIYFGIGYAKVMDLGKYNHYEFFYGKEESMMMLHAGYYLLTKVVDLGVDFGVGYYHATGHPLKSLGSLKVPLKSDIPADQETDPNQKLELSLVPLRVLATAAYSPFYNSRRIVLRGFMGLEYLHVEETLSANLAEGTSEKGVSKYTLAGWNQGVVTGGMLSISLSGLEARSDYALKSMGVDRVYLSPFFEIVTTTNDKMGNYDRKTYGIYIDFEGLR